MSRHMRITRRVPWAAVALACALLSLPPALARQAPGPAYTLLSKDASQTLAVRTAGGVDAVSLDDLAPIFGLTIHNDPAAGGATVTAGAQTIALTPNQTYVSVAGRLVALSSAVTREGRAWIVPMDFLSRAIGPALGQRIEIRRASRLVLVGDVRVPQLSVRLDRQGPSARLAIDISPPTQYHLTRAASRLLLQFDAIALDTSAIAGLPSDLIAGMHADGATLVIDLAPNLTATPAPDDSSGVRATIDFTLPVRAAPGSPAPAAAAAAAPAQTGTRTIVIDPGHGGADTGVKAADGTMEKDVTLAMAHRLKSAIEERLGLRVLLTRDSDTDVPVDRRAAFANNNKADVLVSLHANGSLRPAARGAQVLSLSMADYADQVGRAFDFGVAVPVAGGGTRTIAATPWALAQIPFAPASTALAGIVDRRLREHNVPMHDPSLVEAPLRLLVGANMPAVLIEMGFLSNADDAHALGGADLPVQIVDALVAAITDVRAGVPASGAGGGR